MKFKKFYITAAIDYTNSKPHLGHAYEKIITDVIARWHKIKGDDVFFLIGTDEHGQKVERAAKAVGKSSEDFVTELVESFKKLYKKLNIKYSYFIRTTDPRHEKVAKQIFKKVYDKGEIEPGTYEGLYCVSCEAFFTEKDAINGKCPIHKKELELVKEDSYFFKLNEYQKKIIKHIKEHKDFIIPESRRNEILSRLKEPLNKLSVSRTSFKWGIPLPEEIPESESHVMYVWFDALTNYATALCKKVFIEDVSNRIQENKFWPPDVQVIGKDILWFHTVVWSAILLSLGIKLPKTIFVHGFVNIGGEKLSKTRGIVVDPLKLSDKYGTDALRYFLMREIPSGQDGDFSEESLINRINSELADALGNLVNRVLVLVEKNFDGAVPESSEKDLLSDLALKTVEKVNVSMENFQFHNALNDIFHLVNEANKYINQTKPWEIKDKQKLGNVLYNLLETLRFTSILLYPFIPETAEKIIEQLGLEKKFSFDDLKWGLLKSGTKTKREEILFKKIEIKV